MSDPSLHYTMLFTAQGMGNLISMTKAGSDVVVYTALVDCGSASTTIGEVDRTVAFLQDYIDGNRKATPGRAFDIDLLVISHSDDDHWSLIPKLLNIYTGSNTLRIKKIVYGNTEDCYTKGLPYSKRVTGPGPKDYNVLVDLNKNATVATKPFIAPQTPTSYFDTAKGVEFDSVIVSGVTFRFVPMCANVVSTRSAVKPEALNTVSICLAVLRDNGKGGFEPLLILPGDMTYETILFLQGNLNGKTDFAACWVLSCPHHGSRNTIADKYNVKKNKYSIAEWFADYVTTSALAISAGFTTHRHPFDSVIELLSPDVGTHEDDHNYVSYVYGGSQYYKSTNTDEMIYTSYDNNLKAKTVFTNAHDVEAHSSRFVFTISGPDMYVTTVEPNAPSQPGQNAEIAA